MGKRERQEELEIDLSQPRPPSKKELRRIKKLKESRGLEGDLDQVWKTQKAAKKSIINVKKQEEQEQNNKKSEFGVWIGNLDYTTSKNEIREWIVSNCKESIKDNDITRVHLPQKEKKNKGFAYIDFKTKRQVEDVLKLSNTNLNGRCVLIKDANCFDGRPRLNITSKVLFIGNLPFDTTEQQIREKFDGDDYSISRIRMATFQDNPSKCKGFAFIDYDSINGTKYIFENKDKFINWTGSSGGGDSRRKLRLEVGQDRSKVSRKLPVRETEREIPSQEEEEEEELPQQQQQQQQVIVQEKVLQKPRQQQPTKPTPGQLLAQAPRASAGIVATTGRKIVF